MLPEIVELKLPETQELEPIQNLGKSFLFNFDTNEFVLRDGKPVVISGIESIKVWIEKVLRTEKFRWRVYDGTEYGITIEDIIIGHGWPINFLESELKREITEALLKHPEIQSIAGWEIYRESDVLNVSFQVILKNGETFAEEVAF